MMTDHTEWAVYDGRLLAEVIREWASLALAERVEHEILAPWRAMYAADPTSPPPPDITLATNPWWWTSINAETHEAEAVAPEFDPIGRLTATDPRVDMRFRWAESQIRAFRAHSLHAEARKLFDALAAGEVSLLGIREPALAHGGVPQALPAAALRSLQWRLTAESAVISLPIGTGDSIAFSDARLAIAVMDEPEPPADSRKRNKGGRPPRREREIFNVEVTRRMFLDGGNLTKREFRIEMKQWAEDNWNPAPDGRTVERWIDEMVPPGLLPK